MKVWNERWPLEKTADGTKAPSALAGLRNMVRMILREVEAGNSGEVKLQLDALLDDLSSSDVAFEWSGGETAQNRMAVNAAVAKEKAADEHREGIAAYCTEHSTMVD